MIKKQFGIKQMPESEIRRIEEVYTELLHYTPTDEVPKPNEIWIPAWSSSRLEQLIIKTLSSPEGCISDLFLGFWKALYETNAPLTETMSHFIKDIVTYSWLKYCWLYKERNYEPFERVNFEWMILLVNKKECTQAQAYLVVLLLNYLPVEMVEECKESILSILKINDFIEEHRAYYLSIFPE